MSENTPDALTDFHAHFLTDRYVAAAHAGGITQPDGMPSWPQWSVQDHLQLMDETSMARAILSVSSPGVHFGDDSAAADLARHVNAFAADVIAEHPNRFSFFASLPLPCVEAARDEVVYAMDTLGALGVVLMSNARALYLGNSSLDGLWHLLNQRRAITFIHPTSPPNRDSVALGRPSPMVEFMFETTRTVTDLVFAGVTERYPDIRFLIPHCGATLPLLADRIELFRSLMPGSQGRPQASLTTRQQLQRFWYDLAGTPFPAQATALVDAVGEDQLLFGSDYCWTPPVAVAQHVTVVEQGPRDWRSLTAANARRLLADSAPNDTPPDR